MSLGHIDFPRFPLKNWAVCAVFHLFENVFQNASEHS